MVYLDNAATTPIHEEVIDVMHVSMKEFYGNPSSIHSLGRKSKNLIETARKSIASHFGVSSSEIIFTSSGTEADNLILFNAVRNLGVQRIITSKIEHHAVLHCIEALQQEDSIQVDYVELDNQGDVNLTHLEELLQDQTKKTLVSLMYINNEIGNMLPINIVANACKKYNAFFHSDTVQAIGHYPIDLKEIQADFIVGSAHKFHGPKGVGFAFFRNGFGISPIIHGGNQEKGARSSTENLHSIIGMEKALTLSLNSVHEDVNHINELKVHCIESFKEIDSSITFNGSSDDLSNSSCTILSICFPKELSMLLFQLDLNGIAVSGGSACQSGSNQGSHVLKEIKSPSDTSTSIRVSFSKFNSKQDIDILIQTIKELL